MSSSSTSSDDERKVQVRRHLFKMRHARKRQTFHKILKLMREYVSDDETFGHYFGISKSQFSELQSMLLEQVNKIHSYRNMKPIRGKDRLGLCLRFLASGKSFRDLSNYYNLYGAVVENTVREVCKVIVNHLRPLVMPPPSKEMWERIASEFKQLHGMPNCLGSLNGKHINIMNQKLYIFLALVDANYKFVMIDVGDYDLTPHDIWDTSAMAKSFQENDLQIPNPELVDQYPHPLPYVMVGSNSFPPRPYLITKFKDSDCEDNDANKVFNCRIDPIKETGDEAMGRLRRRWRILQKYFPVPPHVAERVVFAACCLENYFTPTPA